MKDHHVGPCLVFRDTRSQRRGHFTPMQKVGLKILETVFYEYVEGKRKRTRDSQTDRGEDFYVPRSFYQSRREEDEGVFNSYVTRRFL